MRDKYFIQQDGNKIQGVSDFKEHFSRCLNTTFFPFTCSISTKRVKTDD